MKTLGDAVGLPDEQDKEAIRRMILRYEKKHPGYIQGARDEAKREHQAQGGKTAEFGEVNKAARGRVLFELPEELYQSIYNSYPLMFSDTKHLRWFVKNFKELLIPEKY
jgi:hypothetical protein